MAVDTENVINIESSILNSYVKKPKNYITYKGYRGVTDFTDIGQFGQFETGYSFLVVIEMPKFMEALGKKITQVGELNTMFKNILEYEFRGLSGLPDISSETMEITNGVQSVNLINKVTEDSAVSVSMSFFEKSGMPISKYVEYYLTGIKDKRSEAKTYHGAIAANLISGDVGPEQEVFTLLYIMTDNTYLEVERATLLTNAQITGIENMTESNRGDIANKEISLNFNCFPITGAAVDKAAKNMLATITGVKVNTNASASSKYTVEKTNDTTILDSTGFNYNAISKVNTAVEAASK